MSFSFTQKNAILFLYKSLVVSLVFLPNEKVVKKNETARVKRNKWRVQFCVVVGSDGYFNKIMFTLKLIKDKFPLEISVNDPVVSKLFVIRMWSHTGSLCYMLQLDTSQCKDAIML